jgi:hypothetical protein
MVDLIKPPTPFIGDPAIRYLGTVIIPRVLFHDLPAHPNQRQTALHAVSLLKSGVLNYPLDIHRNVDAHILSEDLDELERAFAVDPLAVIEQARAQGDVFKENGHTRDELWHRAWTPVPETVRLTMWGITRHSNGVSRLYKSFDALQAVKGHKDEMQSTLNAAGIDPVSELIAKATTLGAALEWATAVACGSVDYKRYPVELLAAEEPLSPFEQEVRSILTKLGTVRYFKPAIVALDKLGVTPEMTPVLPPPFIGGYLCILQRNPEEGREFLERLKESDSGETTGVLMDAFAAIKNVRNYVTDPRRRIVKPQTRMIQILNCVLNCFEGWLNTDGHAYTVDKFPFRPNAIATFNPALRRSAQAFDREAAKKQANLKAQAQAERIKRRESAVDKPLPLADPIAFQAHLRRQVDQDDASAQQPSP